MCSSRVIRNRTRILLQRAYRSIFKCKTGCGGLECSGETVDPIELRVLNCCRDSRRIPAALDLGKAQARAVVEAFQFEYHRARYECATVVHASQVLTPTRLSLTGSSSSKTEKSPRLGTAMKWRSGRRCDCVATGMTVVPGFVDVHIHGAGGQDVMQGTPEALRLIAETVARFGTTSIVATTVTASPEETIRSLAAIANYIHNGQALIGAHAIPAAEILGIHLEGPFISKLQRGVHPENQIAAPSLELSPVLGSCGRLRAHAHRGA